jgi:hypothetical protein
MLRKGSLNDNPSLQLEMLDVTYSYCLMPLLIFVNLNERSYKRIHNNHRNEKKFLDGNVNNFSYSAIQLKAYELYSYVSSPFLITNFFILALNLTGECSLIYVIKSLALTLLFSNSPALTFVLLVY